MLTHKQILQAFRTTFPALTDEQLSQCAGWDSIEAVTLMLALEQEAGGRLSVDTIAACRTFDDIMARFGPHPKKGLITDLDDTLWGGIRAENEPIDRSGYYAEYLALLQREHARGLLVAVATKNDPAVVATWNLDAEPLDMFPVEAGWSSKVRMVSRILRTWNVLSKDVVFVDDSSRECAEVLSAFPDMTVVHAIPDADTLHLLSSLIHRPTVGDADVRRVKNIRSNVAFAHERSDAEQTDSLDTFLASLLSRVTFRVYTRHDAPRDTRARIMDLFAKVNQWNLTGDHDAPAAATHFFTVEYTDRFGDLGIIAVLAGHYEHDATTFVLDGWVMSCRAFGRDIEQQSLYRLWESLDPTTTRVVFRWVVTPHNAPVQMFIRSWVETPPVMLGTWQLEDR